MNSARSEQSRAWLYAALIVAVILLAAVLAVYIALRPVEEEPSLPQESAALLSASADLDTIRVSAVLDADKKTLDVTQTMLLRNRTGQDQDAVVLRSWSGAYWAERTSPAAAEALMDACYGGRFESGGLSMTSASIGGESVTWTYLDDALTVLSLPTCWAANELCEVTLVYTVQIPDCAGRFGYSGGVYALGNVFPTPAVWSDGAWRTDEYASVGEPFVSECANWEVAVSVPDSYTVAASGFAEAVVHQSTATYRYSSHGVRDFALVIREKAASAQVMSEGVLITAYAASSADAHAIADTAKKAIASYTSRYGAYPYPTLTLCEANLPFDGMTYPCLSMVSSDVIASGGESLEAAVAFETAHQWWSAVVDSDGYYAPWQDESLCEYAVLDYWGDVYGETSRQSRLFSRVETALRVSVSETLTAGSPIDYFSDWPTYSVIVRQRGAALWTALESFLGRKSLQSALQTYYAQYSFRNASREDLEAVLSNAAGQNLAALFDDYLDTRMN